MFVHLSRVEEGFVNGLHRPLWLGLREISLVGEMNRGPVVAWRGPERKVR